MTMTAAAALLVLVAPVWATSPAAHSAATANFAAAADSAAVVRALDRPVQVQVTARVVVVDREEATRVGLSYVVLGHDRVRVGAGARRGIGAGTRRGVDAAGGSGVAVDVLSATAFLDLVRQRRLVRSESTQQVLVMSGAEARVASSQVSVGRDMARTRGPSLTVVPTVGEDGLVHLWVRAGLDDVVSYGWGYEVDGSPAAVDTEIVARAGEDVILASGSVLETTSERGVLRWGSATHDRDVLIVLKVEVRE
jgi:hypothetical protein